MRPVMGTDAQPWRKAEHDGWNLSQIRYISKGPCSCAGLAVQFTTDSKRLFISSRHTLMYRKQCYEVCMEGLVMYKRYA